MSDASATGWLALVATPIGNLEDMTLRGLRILREADLIAAEDTRRAAKLLHHYDIPTRVTSYHAHNEHRKTEDLVDRVAAGQRVAVLSDAGTPTVSDPGFLVVRAALARGIEPEVIPGASAVTHAVVACGFPVSDFAFLGFLPPKGQKRRRILGDHLAVAKTVIVFESPFRITRLLEDIVAAAGPGTRVALLRELTKLHEEHLRGTAAELLERYANTDWKGEFTVAITIDSHNPQDEED